MSYASKSSWCRYAKLPDSFCFLSGLPSAARLRRVLMPIQGFVDDSGGKGHSRHFVLAGLAADSEQWAHFSDEWAACLATPPSVRYFKMSHAASCTGEFRNFSNQERDEKLRQLAQIINCRVMFATYSVIDLDAHAVSWGAELQKPLNEPYFFPFHNTILAMAFTLWDAGWRERFEIIFDDQVIFGPRAKSWYPVIRSAAKRREGDASSILPIDPVFRSDDEFLPIQAADMFAWCVRRNKDNPTENSFTWLLPELKDVVLSKYAQYYDAERMNDVLQQSKDMQSEAAEVWRIYRETFGDDDL